MTRSVGKTTRAPWFAVVAPGILVAATGVGAGDLLTAGLAGSAVGLGILWAAGRCPLPLGLRSGNSDPIGKQPGGTPANPHEKQRNRMKKRLRTATGEGRMPGTYLWDGSAASAGHDAEQIRPELECGGQCLTFVCPLEGVLTRNRRTLSDAAASNRYGVPRFVPDF